MCNCLWEIVVFNFFKEFQAQNIRNEIVVSVNNIPKRIMFPSDNYMSGLLK